MLFFSPFCRLKWWCINVVHVCFFLFLVTFFIIPLFVLISQYLVLQVTFLINDEIESKYFFTFTDLFK